MATKKTKTTKKTTKTKKEEKKIATPAPKEGKTVSVTSSKDFTSDIETFGNPDMWKLITKAWNKKEGWLKSTKALSVGKLGCLVQVSTETPNGVAEAITFVPNIRILEQRDDSGKVINRILTR